MEFNTSDTYTNIDATGEPDLAWAMHCKVFGLTKTPLECGSVDQSVWFTMQGDGGTYLVTTNCAGAAFYSNDAQMALYKGSCDALELVLANDDLMPSGVPMTVGIIQIWIDAS